MTRRFLARMPARDRPFHDVPGLVPTDVEQASASQDVGLEQHVDGMPLEGDGEPRAGQCPGDADPPDAMHGASDPGEMGMEPGRAIAMIEVPPAPGGDVIIERGPAAAFRTSEGGVASMGEPEVDAVFPGSRATRSTLQGLSRAKSL